MAKRKKEHEIGDRAVKIVLSRAPDHWVHQEQNRDYGIDLKFEVFHDERHSGHEFGVQSRGTQKLKIIKTGEFVSCLIEVENLVDHVDKRRYPVYLFHVDVETGRIYWEFLQQHAMRLNSKWRTQKEVTIRIPVCQNLDELDDFVSRFDDHLKFVKELHPSSVEAALDKVRNEFGALDDRFQVDVASSGEDLKYKISPKEPVQLTLKMAPQDAETLREFEQTGNPVQFDAEVGGSVLMEKLGITRVRLLREADTGFAVKVVGLKNGRVVASIDLPETKVCGGTAEMRIETSESHPITVKGLFLAAADSVHTTQWKWSLSKWNKQRILDLPHFDSTFAFFSSCSECDSFQTLILKDDVRIPSLPTPLDGHLTKIGDAITTLNMARELAHYYNLNPPLDLNCDTSDIDVLHWLTFDRKRKHVPHMFFQDAEPELAFTLFKRESLPTSAKQFESPGIRQVFPTVTFDFFGEPIQLGPVTLEYSAIATRLVEDTDYAKKLPDDQVLLEFVGGERMTVEGFLEDLADNPIVR